MISRTLLLTVALSLFVTPAQAQQITFSTVALSGQQAPGTTAGVNYSSFALPTLNAAGQVSFFATVAGPGVTSTNNDGIWSGVPGSVVLVARDGDPAPGMAAGVNYSFSLGFTVTLNANGQNAFSSPVAGAGVTSANDSGFWSGAPGSVALLGREGDPAPGTAAGVNYASTFFVSTWRHTLNADGQSAFPAGVAGPGVTNANNQGLWSGTPGSVALVARGGNPASGMPAGVNYSTFSGEIPALNSTGQMAFRGGVTGSGITGINDTGIWTGVPGSLALLAREGDQAPGTAAGVKYSFFGKPALNGAGRIVFSGQVTGPGVTGANGNGLWSGTPGSVELLARQGDPAPGTAAGCNYDFLDQSPKLNRDGLSVFLATVTGTGVTSANDTGIWKGKPGSLAKVVYEGEPAPGAGNGTLFGNPTLSTIALNELGEVVFVISLTGPDVTTDNDSSLWFSDAAGNLSLIVREGGSIEVAPGVTRIVSNLYVIGGSGAEEGFSSGFNDVSQVAFMAQFTDISSGIFIATQPGLTPPASQLLNIATRMRVQTGENVLIGGFIITGTDPKQVIIRGIGPSLSAFFSGTLPNPRLELFQGNTLLQSNDDWKTDQRTEIEATGIPPSHDLEAAIVRTLTPGNYTAILRGDGNSTGIGVVEAYDLNSAANSELANIATRGFVETGDNVMIGGLIVGPAGGLNAKVVARAIGPTLGNFGINGALPDPTLELVNSSGTVLRSNNDWKDSQRTEIEAVNLQPGDDRESALVQMLAPGNYTAVVRGNGNTTGVGLVEVYHLH